MAIGRLYSAEHRDQRLAYVDRVRGRQAGGLYVARVDGTQRRLIAQLDYWGVGSPTWSPDGQWLMASIVDTDQFAPASNGPPPLSIYL